MTVTTIKASCPVCGEVDLTAPDITLQVVSGGDGSSYSFICPTCRDDVVKRADDHIVTLLMSAGVIATVIDRPTEAAEPKTGPPLTYDDLLDLLVAMSRTDLLAAALVPQA